MLEYRRSTNVGSKRETPITREYRDNRYAQAKLNPTRAKVLPRVNAEIHLPKGRGFALSQ